MTARKDAIEEARFLALYEANLQPLRRYVLRVLGNAALADDVVQECFVRALTAANLPEAPEQARAYIFRIASNIIVDRWRRRKQEIPLDAATIQPSLGEDAALRLDLGRIFAMLSAKERQLIWLAFVEGFDHPAIADQLGVRPQSVKVLLFRAREKFAALLRRSGYDEG
jgi:RNA polymerase sigma-70 factor (ECF subfamily)